MPPACSRSARARTSTCCACPPLSREQDVGPATLLVAARYCKAHRALLIVDPPAQWLTADDALRGMREWNLSNENALMYFPRILAHDKLRGHFEAFAPCGAVAGMLARSDETSPVWGPAKIEDAILRPGFRPSCLVSEDRRMRLACSGSEYHPSGALRGTHRRTAADLGGRDRRRGRVAEPRGAAARALHPQQPRARDALGAHGAAGTRKWRSWSAHRCARSSKSCTTPEPSASGPWKIPSS